LNKTHNNQSPSKSHRPPYGGFFVSSNSPRNQKWQQNGDGMATEIFKIVIFRR